MAVAVIDIGTNSIKLVVGERKPGGEIAIVREAREITRLGEGLSASGQISAQAMERSLMALKSMADQAYDAGAERIAAIGTAALRDAKNGEEFLQAAAQAGVAVEIITGEREARLAYATVRVDSTLGLDTGRPLLVFDIGGGSTELVCGADVNVESYSSFPIGAVSLTERFLPSDPPSDGEYRQAREQASRLIASCSACRGWELQITGIGGTVVNTASIAKGGVGSVHGCKVTMPQITEIALRLRSLPLAERRNVRGLEPARADIILGGLAILEAILESFDASRFIVTARGIRYGLLMEMLQ